MNLKHLFNFLFKRPYPEPSEHPTPTQTPPNEDSILFLLSLLQEECAEVIHIVSKAFRFGLENFHPDDSLKIPNRQLIAKEVGDVICLIELLGAHGLFSLEELDRYCKEKRVKVEKFHPWIKGIGDHETNTKEKEKTSTEVPSSSSQKGAV